MACFKVKEIKVEGTVKGLGFVACDVGFRTWAGRLVFRAVDVWVMVLGLGTSDGSFPKLGIPSWGSPEQRL